MRNVGKHLVWIAPLLCLAWLASKAVPPKDEPGTYRTHAFGELPAVYKGRVKPIDTVARNSLSALSERQTFRDENGEKRPAIEWFLDVISDSDRADVHRVFHIPNTAVQQTLGLEPRKRFRYAYEEIRPQLATLDEQYFQVTRKDPAYRDAYDEGIIKTMNKTFLFKQLQDAHRIPLIRRDRFEEDMEHLARFHEDISRNPLVHIVPPVVESDEWRPFVESAIYAEAFELLNPAAGDAVPKPNPAVESYEKMFIARRAEDPQAFNDALAGYQAWLHANPPADTADIPLEIVLNDFQPFYHCSVLYVLAFVLTFFSWLGLSEILRRTTFWILAVAFTAHALAIAARVLISDYPPVTNLYGTAIFIGATCVMMALILERFFPLGIANLTASIAGFVTLLIAHKLYLRGSVDTMEMMQAVLDTQFWLATHVVTITLGYAATFVAGLLGIIYIVRGVFTRSLTREVGRSLVTMMYGTVCFAILLSFVGTVLGGLWADDSWGRFWGWDVKENGALIIVLWNALILHARWGGMVRDRGLAVLAVVGNVVTTWSWFGVNQLGVGLHSYGKVDEVSKWLFIFAGSQLLIMGSGLIPKRMWRSSAAPVQFASAPSDPTLGGAPSTKPA